LQKVRINPRITIGNHDCANGLLIKFNWPGPADDSVDITHLSQAPETCQQQGCTHATTLRLLSNTGRPEEAPTGAFVSREADDLFLNHSDVNGDVFFCEANGNLVGPGNGKFLLYKLHHLSDLKRLGTTNKNSSTIQLADDWFKRGKLEQIYQHVRHDF